ncbi:hypothetical protein DL93DRAFT_2224922 [Clavulina sp. PMI_390]|nr:hypothetical protein DL93DRAFT_2224922 [Clavulina sp. PMI_390]
MPLFPLDVRSASSAIQSLADAVDSCSVSELDLFPLLLLDGNKRKQSRSSLESTLASIDSSLANLESLIAMATTLRDKVANWRLWVAQPLSGVRALPEELLREIFTLAVGVRINPEDPTPDWKLALAIRHTCTSWRKTSDGCSMMWRDLTIRNPYNIPLLPLFASRSGAWGLFITFGDASCTGRKSPWWNVHPNSMPIQPQDAKQMKRLYFIDPMALEALSFSREALNVFAPEWSIAEMDRYLERNRFRERARHWGENTARSDWELPQYFLHARRTELLGSFHKTEPLASMHLTALCLHQISQYQIEEVLRISNLPNLSTLELKCARFDRGPRPNEGNPSDELPTVVSSIVAVELVECAEDFIRSLPQNLVFPRLESLSITQESDLNDMGNLATIPLISASPLIRRLCISMPWLEQALDLLNSITTNPAGQILPDLRFLKVMRHFRHLYVEATPEELDGLQLWVLERQRASAVRGSVQCPLEGLHLSEEFIGDHRDWFEANLPLFSVCGSSSSAMPL